MPEQNKRRPSSISKKPSIKYCTIPVNPNLRCTLFTPIISNPPTNNKSSNLSKNSVSHNNLELSFSSFFRKTHRGSCCNSTIRTTDTMASTSCTYSPETSNWLRMRLALFLLTVPVLALGEIQTNASTETSMRTQSGPYPFSLKRKATFWDNGFGGLSNLRKADEEDDDFDTDNEFEDSTAWDDNINGFETKSNNRDLKSSSDENDDYWRNPDYWDDYIAESEDDFYRYIGDAVPPSLLPISQQNIIGFMLASLGATLGSLGGIGGGGLVVPCYVIVTRLNLKQAIPLGSVTVLGGSLAALILNLKRRHPLADRPIIDWDLILVMEPLVLIGTVFGSILHRVISGKLLSVLLVLLLTIVAHTTLVKAKRMYDAEKRYIEHLKSARSDYLSRVASFRTAFRVPEAAWSADALHGAGLESKSRASCMPPSPVRTQSLDSQSFDTTPVSPRMDVHERQRILILNPDFVSLRSDLMEQEKVTPRSKVLALVGKFTVLMFLNITLGGGAFRSPWGILCGSVAFWVVHVIMVAFLFSSAWAAQTYLVNRHELKEIIRFDYVHGDIKWDQRKAIIYPCFFMLAGLFAGMFGSK